ncbi:hypothetical protein CROQUDRAFT_93826 [Cronartium quercuum f. sp. fusiforme G11]|uniref:Uncharacterized protein n=1 Tax=Cronartium quercuum f. sp. fusiforme G11 TaxID=708437 RepID=A0A9P6NJR8_9BASI|nr:hypothetical protein CROQUDRAFT_93826 [Cronartium quercuum f. sp. fusiforme G11]
MVPNEVMVSGIYPASNTNPKFGKPTLKSVAKQTLKFIGDAKIHLLGMRRYVKYGHAEVDIQQVDVEPPLPPAPEIGSRRCRSRAPSGPGPGATTNQVSHVFPHSSRSCARLVGQLPSKKDEDGRSGPGGARPK